MRGHLPSNDAASKQIWLTPKKLQPNTLRHATPGVPAAVNPPNPAGAKPQLAFSSLAWAIQTAGVRPPLAPIPAFPQKGKEENEAE